MKKEQILKHTKKLLAEKFPDRIDRVVLFGSRADETHKDYSDYDFLVILKTDYDWAFENKIVDACYEIDLEYGIVTDIKIISQKELNTIRGKEPYIIDALNRGIFA